ncbi:unnamed protein product [Arabidopsis thaliana]|uniref:Uncharacterized protein n=1 Tax=Arabidopsis thaliana TaxID=3702 RepID=A0A654FCX2_ARATH|nr:unnamed protein product [Arabidopsis thaliana]
MLSVCNKADEWLAVHDQPCYSSQVGGKTGSGSSGSKRAHDTNASDSNSVGSSARPMGRDASKKKVKKKQLKEKELENLEKICQETEEANKLKKMEMFMKLSENEHLNDWSKKLLEKLNHKLFGN